MCKTHPILLSLSRPLFRGYQPKRGVLLALFLALWISLILHAPLLHAEDEFGTPTTLAPAPTAEPSPTTEHSEDDESFAHLPDIETKTFPIRVVRRSNSNRIYMVEDTTDRRPLVGRILLMKKEEEPYLAFRVVKLFPEKRYLALKRVRKYGSHRYLDDGDSFMAVEKLSDLSPPTLSVQDRNEIHELSLESSGDLKARPYDPDLDTGTSPPPKDEETNEDDISDAYTIEETRLIDHHSNWLTAGFGYVRNGAPPAQGGSFYFSAANFRYGINVGKMIFLKEPKIQDSMTAEFGFYFYKSLAFVTLTDAYTVVSLSGSLRYNVITSKSFGFFFYLGLVQGLVLSSVNPDATALATLGSLLPAVGAGLLFEVGPNWYTRVDIGLDSIGLNLVLRF